MLYKSIGCDVRLYVSWEAKVFKNFCAPLVTKFTYIKRSGGITGMWGCGLAQTHIQLCIKNNFLKKCYPQFVCSELNQWKRKIHNQNAMHIWFLFGALYLFIAAHALKKHTIYRVTPACAHIGNKGDHLSYCKRDHLDEQQFRISPN
jgi:hypothetical protein